jgi:hypothetical protein
MWCMAYHPMEKESVNEHAICPCEMGAVQWYHVNARFCIVSLRLFRAPFLFFVWYLSANQRPWKMQWWLLWSLCPGVPSKMV